MEYMASNQNMNSLPTHICILFVFQNQRIAISSIWDNSSDIKMHRVYSG